jgi:5-methylcytosine-specific restriction endonuclease McrA
MKRELVIFAITAFLVANTYYDGKYIEMMRGWKKYYTMIGYAFAGLSLVLYMKKTGTQPGSILTDAASLLKYAPIDPASRDVLTPMMGFAREAFGDMAGGFGGPGDGSTPQHKRMMRSGATVPISGTTKRSVGETKKKYVAANQRWLCGKCNQQLSAWFEIDHRIGLENGGSNEVDNLVALCRECHGEKTAMSRF